MKLLKRVQPTLAWVAAAWLCIGSAQAQVYKCRVGDAVVFADKPCKQGGERLSAARAGDNQGALEFEVLTLHYAVTGDNLAAAYRSLRASGPAGFAGQARWKVAYEFEKTVPANGQCAIARVKIRVVGDILMPEWKQERQATESDQRVWRTMYTELKRHEDGHTQHGREFGLLLKERLLGLGTMPCDAIESRTRQEYSRLYEGLKQRDQEYDRRTNHGLRQDAPQ